MVKFQTVDADDLGTLHRGPGRVWCDSDHDVIHRGCADNPRSCPEAGELSWHSRLRHWREEPDLGAWEEGLLLFVVLPSLPMDCALEILSDVLLAGVNALAQLSDVFWAGLPSAVAPKVGIAEQHVQGGGDISSEKDLVRSQPSRAADGGSDGEESLRQNVFPRVRPVLEEGPHDVAKVPVYSFHLAIALRVITTSVGDADAEHPAYLLVQLTLKLFGHV